jgi:hypothetical protein
MGHAMRRMRHLLRHSGSLLLLAVGTGCATPTANAALPTVERPCPPWVEFPADPYSNVEPAYLGCSNDINLRTTLEDARDRERGRALGPTNGNRESLAVGRYETGQTKPLPSNGSPTPTIVFSGSNGAAP